MVRRHWHASFDEVVYIQIRIQTDGTLALQDHHSEIHLTEVDRGRVLLGAEGADIAPELTADRVTYASLKHS